MMKKISSLLLLLALPCLATAQQKLLTIDDIFDPVKRVDFNGQTPTIRWLKDGEHYLLTNDGSRTDVPRLQRVNARTGQAEPFFDPSKMAAALAALGGISDRDARQLSNRGSYMLNRSESAVLINWSNDLFYYELGTTKAVRITNNPEEEVGET